MNVHFYLIKTLTQKTDFKNKICIGSRIDIHVPNTGSPFNALGYSSDIHLISSPEPKAHRRAYRIPMDPASVVVRLSIRPSVVVRPSTFSNIFSSETAWPIKAKFYVEPPWEGGTKVCINGPGHMTKLAAMPIYGKNLKKSSSHPEPAGRFPLTWYVESGTPAHHSLYK